MKYGDFSSLLQLGVGLNIGTAVLQLYGEIGVQPVIRTLARISQLAEDNQNVKDACGDRLMALEGEFEVFRIRLFNELKKYVIIATGVAIILTLLLTCASFKAGDDISIEVGVALSAISILPTPLILAALWRDASEVLRPLKERARILERAALEASAS